MKFFHNYFLFFFVITLTNCQTVETTQKDDLLSRAAVTSVSNMNGFKGTSFIWHKNATQYYSNPKIGDPTLQGMLQKAIANTLSTKGYSFNKNSWKSDMFVGYVAALESSLSSEEIAEIYGVNPGLPELSND